jgi:hypothetical protein
MCAHFSTVPQNALINTAEQNNLSVQNINITISKNEFDSSSARTRRIRP